MDFSLDPAQLALLETVKHNVKLAQTLGACAFAICLWDTFAYLQVEYRIVWLAKSSGTKFTYLFTRYITLVTAILFFVGFFGTFTQSVCDKYVKIFPAMGVFPIFGVTLLFAIRAYHLYERNKALLIAMLFAAAGQVGGMLAISFVETRSVPTGNGIKACIPTSSGDLFVLYWVFPTVTIGVITLLSVAKSFRLVTVTEPNASLVDKAHQVMFAKYGQIFPICVVLICVTQVIFCLVADEMKRAICSPLSGLLMSVFACQMVLIGQLTVRTSSEGGSYTVNSPSYNNNNSRVQPSGPTTTANSHNFAKLGGLRAFVTSQQAVDEDRSDKPALGGYEGNLSEKVKVKKVDLAFSRGRSESIKTANSGHSFLDTEVTPVDSAIDMTVLPKGRAF